MRHSAGAWSGKTSEVPSFPIGSQAETASHSGREFWDMLSGCKKGHKTWPSTYICSADAPMTSRASTPRRLPGDAECKVHREFRTSRRALNVLSVRVRTVRAGDLIYLPSPGLPHNGTSVGFYPVWQSLRSCPPWL